VAATEGIAATGFSQLWHLQRQLRQHRLPWIPIIVLAVLLVCAALAPLLAPHDPRQISPINGQIPPGESLSYPLGTDFLGRDILSRMIYGARTTVIISLASLLIGAVVGTLIGLVSGYHGGWIDAWLMRTTDAALSFPTILVALVILVFLGAGTIPVILAIVLTVWARFARMIRGEVLTVKGQDFVTMAQIAGVSTAVILWRHIFPNVLNTLMVITSLLVGQIILLEAALSFLGVGLPPGSPAWGTMMSEGQDFILDLWWLALFPGLAITIVVLAFNFFGDWLRDTLDPKMRRSQ